MLPCPIPRTSGLPSPVFDWRQFPASPAGLSSLQRRRQMDNLFSQYFPHMVAALMLMFMLVLGGLSLQDAMRGQKY